MKWGRKINTSNIFNKIFLLAIFCISSQIVIGQEILNVNIEGRITSESKNLKGVNVSITENDKLVKEATSQRNGKFEVILDGNKDYILKASKQGYYSKMIVISTSGITNITYKGWEIDLIKQVDGVKGEVFEKPVGRIYYDKVANTFNYDVDYANRVKAEMNLFNVEISKKVKDNAYAAASEIDPSLKKEDNIKPVLDKVQEVQQSENSATAALGGIAADKEGPSYDNWIKEDTIPTATAIEDTVIAPTTEVANPDTVPIPSGSGSVEATSNTTGVEINTTANPTTPATTNDSIEVITIPGQERKWISDVYYEELTVKRQFVEEENYKMLTTTIYKGTKIREYRKIEYSYGTFYKKNDVDITENLYLQGIEGLPESEITKVKKDGDRIFKKETVSSDDFQEGLISPSGEEKKTPTVNESTKPEVEEAEAESAKKKEIVTAPKKEEIIEKTVPGSTPANTDVKEADE